MSQRPVRGYLVAAALVVFSVTSFACGQAAPPTGPAGGGSSATRSAAQVASTTGPAESTAARSTPVPPAQGAGRATTKAPAAKTGLVIATPADISKLDPHMSTSFQDIIVSFNLYDTLTARDPDLKLSPRLATEWKATGEKTWEFKLRPNVTFHNGDPLTSADVKFSIERTYDPNAKTLVATVFTTIERIETPDPLTVLFITRQPDPLLPSRLAFYGGQIIPKAYFEKVGPDELNAKPVGSGVASYVNWHSNPNQTVELRREVLTINR